MASKYASPRGKHGLEKLTAKSYIKVVNILTDSGFKTKMTICQCWIVFNMKCHSYLIDTEGKI